jgi:hypothetical protein
MPLLTRSDIARLAADGPGAQVSIYLPTHPYGVDAAQDPIRFRNLLDCAEEALEAHGASSAAVARLLDPALPLLADPAFWQHQGEGLAVFLADGGIATYRVPIRFEELVVVGSHPHLKPLLPLVGMDGRVDILALSQARVRLFEATREAIREIDLEDVPKTLRDVVGYDFEQRSLQFHTGTSRTRGGKRAVFHGHGDVRAGRKTEIREFLHAVDDGVCRLLGPDPGPLVLAGVEYVTAMYRDLSRHPDIVGRTIEGNPDHLDPSTLHERALEIIEPRLSGQLDQALARDREAIGGGRTSDDLEAILGAAEDGRIDTLVVAVGVRRWGRWDGKERRVDFHEMRRTGDRDLLDVAAIRALATGAEVFAIGPDRVPGSTGIAAILRY